MSRAEIIVSRDEVNIAPLVATPTLPPVAVKPILKRVTSPQAQNAAVANAVHFEDVKIIPSPQKKGSTSTSMSDRGQGHTIAPHPGSTNKALKKKSTSFLKSLFGKFRKGVPSSTKAHDN